MWESVRKYQKFVNIINSKVQGLSYIKIFAFFISNFRITKNFQLFKITGGGWLWKYQGGEKDVSQKVCVTSPKKQETRKRKFGFKGKNQINQKHNKDQLGRPGRNAFNDDP